MHKEWAPSGTEGSDKVPDCKKSSFRKIGCIFIFAQVSKRLLYRNKFWKTSFANSSILLHSTILINYSAFVKLLGYWQACGNNQKSHKSKRPIYTIIWKENMTSNRYTSSGPWKLGDQTRWVTLISWQKGENKHRSSTPSEEWN